MRVGLRVRVWVWVGLRVRVWVWVWVWVGARVRVSTCLEVDLVQRRAQARDLLEQWAYGQSDDAVE